MTKDELLNKINDLKHKKAEAEQLAKLQEVFQHAYKIFLNSVYGFTGTQYSPVYSRDIAESVTLTGQMTIKEMVKFTNMCLNKIGKTPSESEWVIAGDTDSVFGDSKIYLNNKKVKIEDAYDKLVNEGGDVKVLSNDSEIVFSKKKNKTLSLTSFSNIKNISKHKVTKQMWSINIPNYEELKMTGDHSIMVYRDGNIIECKPNEILKSDKFIVL